MHIATLITLILLAVLALLARLLFSFSYNNFIPSEMSFGVTVYLAFVFILYASRETYFYKVNRSSYNKDLYITIPAILNIIVALIIYYHFEFHNSFGNHPLGEFVNSILKSLGLFFAFIIIQIILDSSAKAKHKAIYEDNNIPNKYTIPFNNLIKKTSIFTIPILLSLIAYVSFLVYTDYSSAGMKHSYTTKTNIEQMYQRSIDNQDITFCDHIINYHSINIVTRDCYAEFFEQIKEIKQFNSRSKTTESTDLNFFSLYHKLYKHCERTNKKNACEIVLLEKTIKILERSSKRKISYGVERNMQNPKYLMINISNQRAYKDIHDLLVKDLNRFMSSSIYLIKKSTTENSNYATTKIFIDIRKLVNNESDLSAIENIVETRKLKLDKIYNEQTEKRKLKLRKERLKAQLKIAKKRKEASLKYEMEMRKKYNLNSDDQVIPCKKLQFYKCSCVIPMCVNGTYIYDSQLPLIRKINIGPDNQRQILRCLDNIKNNKNPCENVQSILYDSPRPNN